MVFPKAYDRVRDNLDPDRPVFVSGRVSTEDEADSKIIVEEVYFFDDLPKNLWLKFDDMDKYNELWTSVYEILRKHRGVDNVNVRVIKENKLRTITKSELGISADESTVREIEAILGERTAVIR